jgi:hypothetical protein
VLSRQQLRSTPHRQALGRPSVASSALSGPRGVRYWNVCKKGVEEGEGGRGGGALQALMSCAVCPGQCDCCNRLVSVVHTSWTRRVRTDYAFERLARARA